MSEDYLWDKTGEDQEIERLEGVLSVFRYQETDPPILPTTLVVPVVEKGPRFRFSFAFAFAGATAAVVIGLGLFWLMPRYGGQVAFVGPASPATGVETSVPINTLPPEKSLRTAPPVSISGDIKPSLARHTIPASFKQSKVVAKATPKKVRIEDLTKEEKYAYSQLMLALSITSSKLMVVRETIDRMESDKASDKQNFK